MSRTFASLSHPSSNNFMLLRLLLAVLVIYGHSFWLCGAAEPFERFINGQIGTASLAVVFFFAISGFLVTHSWHQNKNARAYMLKRTLRIYPGFICAAMISVLAFGYFGAQDRLHYFSLLNPINIVGSLAALQLPTVSPVFVLNPQANVLNGSLWTIPCEFCMYLLVLAIGVIGLWKKSWLIFCMYIGSLVSSRVLLHFVPGFTSHTLPVFGNVAILFSFLTAFLAGCTFWCFREKIPRSRLIFALCAALLFVCTKNGFPIYLAVCSVYCLFYLASSEKLRFFRGAKADFSYGLYLYAYPVQQLIRMNHPEISPMILFVEATAITCVFALASWYLVESPCLKLKRGLGKKAEKATPPAVKIPQPV